MIQACKGKNAWIMGLGLVLLYLFSFENALFSMRGLARLCFGTNACKLHVLYQYLGEEEWLLLVQMLLVV